MRDPKEEEVWEQMRRTAERVSRGYLDDDDDDGDAGDADDADDADDAGDADDTDDAELETIKRRVLIERQAQAALPVLKGPPDAETEAHQQLDHAVERATAHSLDQLTAERELAGTGNQAKRLAGDLKGIHMTLVAEFARAKLQGVPDFKALAQVPHSLQGPSLVTAAHAMATAATPYAAQLEKAQFPTESVPQLASAATALDTEIAHRTAAKSRRVVATAGVRQELARGREAVAILNPIVIRRLAGRQDVLAGWHSAKRVTNRPQGAAVPVVPVVPMSSVVLASIGTAGHAPSVQEVKAA